MTNTLPQGVFVSPNPGASPARAPRAIIFANGPLAAPQAARAALRADDRLYAADGGLHHLLALGLTPHVLVGDLDSVAPGAAEALEAAGVRVLRHPARKDQTDLELALHAARTDGAEEMLIFGALGGRWDQTLANLLLLAHPAFRGARLRLLDGAQQIYLAQGLTRLEGEPGDTVSLIALGGDAHGVTTTGLEYPLSDEPLPFGGTLGISNVLLGRTATVAVREGLVACVVLRAGGQEAGERGSRGEGEMNGTRNRPQGLEV